MELQSTQINELAAALAKAQAEMDLAGKTSDNPFFDILPHHKWRRFLECVLLHSKVVLAPNVRKRLICSYLTSVTFGISYRRSLNS